jgi:hypothetical protein
MAHVLSRPLPVIALGWFLVLFTLGCAGATPYQAAAWQGGYEESRLDAESFRVEFRGNGYTSRLQVENALYYRCAELTVANLAAYGAREVIATLRLREPGARAE